MKSLYSPLELKSIDDTGTFEGLASVYGNVDLGQDVVQAGAFKEFKTTKDGSIRILDGHNTRMPVGKGIITDTHVGLAIKGKLNLAVSYARNVYELMKDGIIDGLSIGFDTLPGGSEVKEDGTRILTKLRLWEVSVTSFPMNEMARISGIKTLEKVTNIRDLEDLLREATGLSRAQAKLHAASVWKTLTGQREADGEVTEDVQQLIADIGKRFA